MKPALKIPPILLEGDEPAPTVASGPGQKFVSTDVPSPSPGAASELPTGYGTGRLLLVARDPHSLYAAWDPSLEQAQRLEGKYAGPDMSVRVYLEATRAQPAQEFRLTPGAKECFVSVKQAGAKYVAEVGYYLNGQWQPLATSGAATTPPDKPAAPIEPQFVTFVGAMSEALPARPANVENAVVRPVASIPKQRRPAPTPPKPAMPPHHFVEGIGPSDKATVSQPSTAPPWTEAQEEALKQAGAWDSPVRPFQAPPAWDELAGVAARTALSSMEAAGLEFLPEAEEAGITSPGAAPAESRGFWFTVDAELVVYGATEPGALVKLEGRPIELRPDGTFSFRLAFPDGVHKLSLAAESGRGDVRNAKLAFVRSTETTGL